MWIKSCYTVRCRKLKNEIALREPRSTQRPTSYGSFNSCNTKWSTTGTDTNVKTRKTNMTAKERSHNFLPWGRLFSEPKAIKREDNVSEQYYDPGRPVSSEIERRDSPHDCSMPKCLAFNIIPQQCCSLKTGSKIPMMLCMSSSRYWLPSIYLTVYLWRRSNPIFDIIFSTEMVVMWKTLSSVAATSLRVLTWAPQTVDDNSMTLRMKMNWLLGELGLN